MKIASWLKEQKKVTDVYYVGLPEHPGYEINQKQSRGAGSMISFRTDTDGEKGAGAREAYFLCGESGRRGVPDYLSDAADTRRCAG